jgi:hypothetical protein
VTGTSRRIVEAVARRLFQIRRQILLAGAMVASLAGGAAHAQPHPASEVLIREFRLARNGRVWITPTEQRLIDRLDALPNLRTRIIDTESALGQTIEQNAAVWQQLDRVQQTIKQLEQSRKSSNGSPRNKVEEELRRQRKLAERLQQQAVEPAKLGGVPPVRARLIALSNDRNELLLSLLWIRSAAAGLPEEYRRLAANPSVSGALRELGRDNQLGPLRDYNQRLKQLDSYDKLAFVSRLPMYRTGDRWRVSLIVNDQAPATFTWRDSHDPTIVTTALAEAAGISVPATARRLRLSVGGGRQVEVRSITIPYVRVGRYLISDVPALLLPPEGEDLGSQIGPVALPDHRAVARPEQLCLTIEPATGP